MKAAPTLHPELAGAVREVLSRAAQPLTLGKLRGQLNPPFKVPPKLKDALAGLLEFEAAHGRIHAWPASTAKSGPRYWTRDSRSYAVSAIVEASAAQPLPASKLIAVIAKSYGRKPAEALLDDLIAEGQLIRTPLFGGAKAKLSSRIPDEAAFRAELDAARKIIDAGYRRLCDESATSGAGLRPAAGLLAGQPSNGARSLADQILETLASLEPQKGLLVTAPRLYRALPPDLEKPAIDSALLRLQLERRVILHRHSNAQSLSDADRQQLIDGGAGNYYVGACWRIEQD